VPSLSLQRQLVVSFCGCPRMLSSSQNKDKDGVDYLVPNTDRIADAKQGGAEHSQHLVDLNYG